MDTTKDSEMIEMNASGKLPTANNDNPDFEATLKEKAATPAAFDALEDMIL